MVQVIEYIPGHIQHVRDIDDIIRNIIDLVILHSNIPEDGLVDFEELGMEAVRKITVKDFPAFIITDNKGNDFFMNL